MGYLTTITINNDALNGFEANPNGGGNEPL